MLQECLGQIDELARFTGSAEAATLKADGILEKITELKNQVELQWLEHPENQFKIEHERDQIKLVVARLRKAELAAREARRKRWFQQRDNFAKVRTTKEAKEAQIEAIDEPSDPTLGVAEEVSANLRRIHQLAQAEVLRSELNIEELESSTKQLTEIQNQYSGVDMLLNGSKRLVKLLDEADAKDRRQMQLALSFLGAVLVWIIYRRILKLPIKLFLWSLARFLGIVRFLVPKSSVDPSETASIVDEATGFVEAAIETTTTIIETILSETSIETIDMDIHPDL